MKASLLAAALMTVTLAAAKEASKGSKSRESTHDILPCMGQNQVYTGHKIGFIRWQPTVKSCMRLCHASHGCHLWSSFLPLVECGESCWIDETIITPLGLPRKIVYGDCIIFEDTAASLVAHKGFYSGKLQCGKP